MQIPFLPTRWGTLVTKISLDGARMNIKIYVPSRYFSLFIYNLKKKLNWNSIGFDYFWTEITLKKIVDGILNNKESRYFCKSWKVCFGIQLILLTKLRCFSLISVLKVHKCESILNRKVGIIWSLNFLVCTISWGRRIKNSIDIAVDIKFLSKFRTKSWKMPCNRMNFWFN